MITNAAVAAELAKGQVTVVDAVTLTISRGRIIRFPSGSGTGGIATPIVDTVRWTSAPRPLRVNSADGSNIFTYPPLASASYSRGKLRNVLGREVVQLDMSVTGDLPITLSTACDPATGVLSGAFVTSLMELCLLGYLDGATVTVDQVVLPNGAFPALPVGAGPASAGLVTGNPIRKFTGIIRQAQPNKEAISLSCCDALILGGGSVPTGVFSPLCRWSFGEGNCPVAWNLQPHFTGTHVPVLGSAITFPTPTSVRIDLTALAPISVIDVTRPVWGFLVPQDGPMMGMRFQLGEWKTNDAYSITLDFAAALPWSWGCNSAHLEFACSKSLGAADTDPSSLLTNHGCKHWDTAPVRSGLISSLHAFSGCPDMPQPEGA